MEAVLEVVAFHLGREVYAVSSEFVEEVCTVKEITHIPCVPEFVVGLIIVRGHFLTVIDLRKFFNLTGTGICDLNKVVIIRSEGVEIGILADGILGVKLILNRELQTSLCGLTGFPPEYLCGITPDHTLVLDIRKIILSNRLTVNHHLNE